MKRSPLFLFVLLLVSFLAGCRYSTELPTYVPIDDKDIDSSKLVPARPYALNSNFLVTSDTLWLCQLPFTDSLPVMKDDEVVVAEFAIHHTDSIDSIWVKVARDQETIGWLRETDLLTHIVPVDPISRCIHWFSNSHNLPFILIVIAFFGWFFVRAYRRQQIKLIWLNDMDSVFPICLTWLFITAAVLYNSMQHFVPETWQRFYYDPSLSPFQLPGILAAFIICLWLIALMGIALLDDIFQQAKAEMAFFYLVGLSTFCIVSYLFFTYVWVYIAYIGWGGYTLLALTGLRKTSRHAYVCGQCGSKIRRKGVCPYCGAINE